MKKVRIGVLGAYRGTSMINYCKRADHAEVVAICDKSPEALDAQRAAAEGLDIAFYERFIGREATVLFEKPRPEAPMGGFTENYIRVEMPYNKDFVNCEVRVRLGGFNEDESALLVDEVISVE